MENKNDTIKGIDRLEYLRNYYHTNKETIAEKQRLRYNENKEKYQKRCKDYYEKNKESIIQKNNIYHKQFYKDNKKELKQYFRERRFIKKQEDYQRRREKFFENERLKELELNK